MKSPDVSVRKLPLVNGNATTNLALELDRCRRANLTSDMEEANIPSGILTGDARAVMRHAIDVTTSTAGLSLEAILDSLGKVFSPKISPNHSPSSTTRTWR